MSVYLDHVDGCLIASGATYAYKDVFKSLGFRWKSRQKQWEHPRATQFIMVIQSTHYLI
uniref:Uncharacterized protein n=1 Tax=viral metagenome TaxID=1070528 RepID=A0A6C0BMR7_9ZZZZ